MRGCETVLDTNALNSDYLVTKSVRAKKEKKLGPTADRGIGQGAGSLNV